jgi:hypothetical protein
MLIMNGFLTSFEMTVAFVYGGGWGGKAAPATPIPLARACHSELNEVE